jgi:exonuclease III
MQSVGNKIHLLEDFTEANQDIQIICLSETWLNKEKLRLFNIPGFQIASYFCRETCREAVGGGVCILTKENVEIKLRMDIEQLALENIFEVCAIEIRQNNMLIINVYWPNTKNNKDIILTNLENLLRLINQKDKNKYILIGGDFNVNFLCNKYNSFKNKMRNTMLNYNFHQTVVEPTRITLSSSTCIDLLFLNFKLTNAIINTFDFGFSDHKGIVFSMPTCLQASKQFYVTKRIFKNNNMNPNNNNTRK